VSNSIQPWHADILELEALCGCLPNLPEKKLMYSPEHFGHLGHYMDLGIEAQKNPGITAFSDLAE
jgi:hypothetical protein